MIYTVRTFQIEPRNYDAFVRIIILDCGDKR